MRLYRVTKNQNSISDSDVPTHADKAPWYQHAKRERQKETEQLTGVDVRGPGRWFTSDIKELDFYIRFKDNNDSVISYVDVPDDIVEDFSTLNIRNGTTKTPPSVSAKHLETKVFMGGGISGKDTEYYLPLEWAEKARILCTGKELQDNNYDVSIFTEHIKLSILHYVKLYS